MKVIKSVYRVMEQEDILAKIVMAMANVLNVTMDGTHAMNVEVTVRLIVLIVMVLVTI